jgi:hypothetical protein
MLNTTLDFLSQELNAYLELKNGMAGDKVVVSNVAKVNGDWAIPNNRLGLSLINIEEERITKEQKTSFVNADGITESYNPEIKLNLYVLVTANFTSGDAEPDGLDYLEGLKQLSYIISFFQEKNVFTNSNSPLLASIDANLSKLIVELCSFTFDQLNNFWSVIGAKYLPSILYKVRMLRFQEKRIQEVNPAIVTIRVQKGNI